MQKLATRYYCLSPLSSMGFVIYDGKDHFLRKRNINFHIESDDYFGTLATVINLVRQEKEKTEKRQNKTLKNLKDDLIYLQKNYKIVKKKRS